MYVIHSESMELNGNKCSTSNQKYPFCRCAECLDNVIVYKGIRKGDVYLLGNKKVMVKTLCPEDKNIDVIWDNTKTELEGHGEPCGTCKTEELLPLDSALNAGVEKTGINHSDSIRALINSGTVTRKLMID